MLVEVGNEMQICEVGSARVPFIEHGEPVDGQAPLFLFGGKDTKASSWRDLPAALGRHVIAVETPLGNEYPENPTVWGYARFMGGAALKLTNRWYGHDTHPDIGGWSLGGMFAQAFALEKPQEIGGSVLLATAPGGITPLLGPITRRGMEAALSIADPDRTSFDAASVYGGATSRDTELALEFADLTHRDIDPVASRRQLLAALGSWTLYAPTMLRSWEPRAHNTLVMLGDDDPVISHGPARWLALCAGMQTYTVRGGGHLFPIDEPETAAVMNDFLDRGNVAQTA